MNQLEFFPLTKEEILRKELEQVKKTNDKVRKKMFVENAKLNKMYLELHNEFEHIKRVMCHGGKDEVSKKSFSFTLEAIQKK